MKSSVIYKGYVIEINETTSNYHFIVKKDNKIILESVGGFPLPEEAEIQGKLYVNRLIASNSGWRVL